MSDQVMSSEPANRMDEEISLVHLPKELLLRILGPLSTDDLLKIPIISRRFYHFIQETPELKRYKIDKLLVNEKGEIVVYKDIFEKILLDDFGSRWPLISKSKINMIELQGNSIEGRVNELISLLLEGHSMLIDGVFIRCPRRANSPTPTYDLNRLLRLLNPRTINLSIDYQRLHLRPSSRCERLVNISSDLSLDTSDCPNILYNPRPLT